jgi:hypothetical protein
MTPSRMTAAGNDGLTTRCEGRRLSGRKPMGRGAHNTQARLIAVSTHLSNAKPPCRALAGSACEIRSQAMASSDQVDIGGASISSNTFRSSTVLANWASLRHSSANFLYLLLKAPCGKRIV